MPDPTILLTDILDDVRDGKIQLPDFQREWVWDNDHVRELLTSICQAFPIGAIMALEAGGDMKFKSRLLAGVPSGTNSTPSAFLLDGQQRLTTLYQALHHSGPVITRDRRGKRIKRWYYIKMLEAIKDTPEWENVIVSVPEKDKKIVTSELEYEKHMMPTNCLLDAEDWGHGYQDYWENKDHPHENARTCSKQFKSIVRNKLTRYSLPVLWLKKETPKEAVCSVFEKVNTGGVPLNTSDLVTAMFAASDFSLRNDWRKRRKSLYPKYLTLENIGGEQFLQVVALLARSSCKKRDILNLRLDDYEECADRAEEGFVLAAKFLRQQFIFQKRDVPYNTQLVPLAAIYANLKDKLQSKNAIDKLERWFWSGIFSEAYGSAIETQFAQDLAEIGEYIRSGTEPQLVREASFTPERLVSLRTRNSAAYKGLYALQMKCGAADWRTGKPLSLATWDEENIDIHHIFPVAWCTSAERKHKISRQLYDSIINKTPIDAKTNRTIGRKAPSKYLKELRKENKNLDAVLRAHWLDPDLLRDNKFSKSFVERGQAMFDLINETIGKPKTDNRTIFQREVASVGDSDESEYIDDYE